jgi:hypothetical protein
VKLFVQSITVGKRHEEDDSGIEVRKTYRFGPPSPPPAESGRELSIPTLKNGRGFCTPSTNVPTLTVVAVK